MDVKKAINLLTPMSTSKKLNMAEKQNMCDIIEWLKNSDNFLLETLKTQLVSLKEDIVSSVKKALPPPPSSYTAAASRAIPAFDRPSPPPKIVTQTIIIKAKDASNSVTLDNVTKAIDNIRGKNTLNINNIHKSKTGFLVEVPKDSDAEDIIGKFSEDDNLKHTVINKAKKLDPVIVINKVNVTYNKNNIVSELCSANPELAIHKDKIIPLFIMQNKLNKQVHDIVLRVAPVVFGIFSTKMLYLGYTNIDWRRRTFVKQCQSCFEFNPSKEHVAECKRKAKSCNNCGKTDHVRGDCIAELECRNCKKHSYYQNQDLHHLPNCRDCPLYNLQYCRIEERTQYDFAQNIPSSSSAGASTAKE